MEKGDGRSKEEKAEWLKVKVMKCLELAAKLEESTNYVGQGNVVDTAVGSSGNLEKKKKRVRCVNF